MKLLAKPRAKLYLFCLSLLGLGAWSENVGNSSRIEENYFWVKGKAPVKRWNRILRACQVLNVYCVLIEKVESWCVNCDIWHNSKLDKIIVQTPDYCVSREIRTTIQKLEVEKRNAGQ